MIHWKPHRHQTKEEEVVNSALHGVGLAYSLMGSAMLILFAWGFHDSSKLVAASVFSFTLVFMYFTSTLYHAVPKPTKSHVLKQMDHVSIYLLIAGGMTPFMMITLNNSLGWQIFTCMWIMALLGSLYKIFFFEHHEWLSTPSYLVMGWLPIIAIKPLYYQLSPQGFYWLLAGGLLYTIGVIFYHSERILFCHAIWHIFVIVGSFCHFVCVMYYVILPPTI